MSFNLHDKVRDETAVSDASTRELAERLMVATIHPDYLDRVEVVEVPDGYATTDDTVESFISDFEEGIMPQLRPSEEFDEDDDDTDDEDGP